MQQKQTNQLGQKFPFYVGHCQFATSHTWHTQITVVDNYISHCS